MFSVQYLKAKIWWTYAIFNNREAAEAAMELCKELDWTSGELRVIEG